MSFRRTILCLLVTPATPLHAQDTLRIDGATGVIPLARALTAAYRERHPERIVEIGAGLSTAERLQALASGKIQLSLNSHGITPEDMRRDGLSVVTVARGGIVFAVNQSVAVAGLTEKQICDLYAGKHQRWRDVGGADDAVVLLTRPPTEVDPEVIRARVSCFNDLLLTSSAQVMARGGDMARALAETPHSIGMTSMTVVSQSGGRIRALTLGGVPATADNIREGRYSLTREFLFVYRGSAPALLREFLAFVQSDAGAVVILANGAVPVR